MKKADEIGEYLKNKGKIQDIGDFKHELEQIVERNKDPENKVEKWINILDDLVSWANESNNIKEMRKYGYRNNS